MKQETLNDRQRAFLMMAVLTDGPKAAELLTLLPPEEQPIMKAGLAKLTSRAGAQKRDLIQQELKRLWLDSRKSTLGDIHADWIVKALQGEEPRVIATILRYLPSETAHAVLESLPEETAQRLPPIAQTFAVDSILAGILKKRLEERFVRPAISSRRLTMKSVTALSPSKLKTFFYELGVRELGFALSMLKGDTAEMVLRLLNPKEADAIRAVMAHAKTQGNDRLKKAQSHLIAMEAEKQDPETLILETGFFVFSKAILPEQAGLVDIIRQKFSFKVGDLLKRYLEKNLPLNSPKAVARYQEEILTLLARLRTP